MSSISLLYIFNLTVFRTKLSLQNDFRDPLCQMHRMVYYLQTWVAFREFDSHRRDLYF